MKCPNCSADLHPEETRGAAVSKCTDCGGLLLDGVNLATIAPDLLRSAESSGGEGERPESDRSCGGCGARFRVLQYEGIVLDFCPACRALWFDRDELDAVLAHMRILHPGRFGHAAAEGKVTGAVSDTGLNAALGFVGEVIVDILDAVFD